MTRLYISKSAFALDNVCKNSGTGGVSIRKLLDIAALYVSHVMSGL